MDKKRFEFNPIRHEYRLEGRLIPSVTGLMKNHMCVNDPFTYCDPTRGSLTHQVFAETVFIDGEERGRIEDSFRVAADMMGNADVIEVAIAGARQFDQALRELYQEKGLKSTRKGKDIEVPRYHEDYNYGIGYTPDFYDPEKRILVEIKTWDGVKGAVSGHTFGDVQASIYSYLIRCEICGLMQPFTTWIFELNNGGVIRRCPNLKDSETAAIIKSLLVMDRFRF